jgi:hypothetical protein
VQDVGVTVDEVLDLYGVTDPDRPECRRLLTDPASAPGGLPAVHEAVSLLREALGAPIADEPPDIDLEPLTAIAALLAFAPEIARWHAEHGVPEAVSRATLADVGRQLALHRREHGRFGLDPVWWLTFHLSGALFALGRLQFLLQGPPPAYRRTLGDEEWTLDIHIPATGPLLPSAVDESLAAARTFFAERFPDRPVRVGTCNSWLLDPYLIAHLPESNIAHFARRFTLVGEPFDMPDDAVHYTFRTRDMDHLDALPRETSLQRTVLERIDAGGTWQAARGYLVL